MECYKPHLALHYMYYTIFTEDATPATAVRNKRGHLSLVNHQVTYTWPELTFAHLSRARGFLLLTYNRQMQLSLGNLERYPLYIYILG